MKHFGAIELDNWGGNSKWHVIFEFLQERDRCRERERERERERAREKERESDNRDTTCCDCVTGLLSYEILSYDLQGPDFVCTIGNQRLHYEMKVFQLIPVPVQNLGRMYTYYDVWSYTPSQLTPFCENFGLLICSKIDLFSKLF